MSQHALEDCPHNQTFEHIGKTLDRLDAHTERQAIAMETIAEQGVMLFNHENRLNKHDQDISEAFQRFRTLDEFKVREEAMATVKNKYDQKSEKFWTDIRQQFTVPVLTTLCFMVWIADHFGVAEKIATLWQKMTKG